MGEERLATLVAPGPGDDGPLSVTGRGSTVLGSDTGEETKDEGVPGAMLPGPCPNLSSSLSARLALTTVSLPLPAEPGASRD